MTLTASIQKRLPGGFSLEVGLSAAPGITMLFGTSGSGKTTLLRCLAGLLTPDAGRITVGEAVLFDSALSRDVPVERRRIGYVFQQLALFPQMTVGDNIKYGLSQMSPADRNDRMRTIADSFSIGGLLSRKPSAISGGERQRAALARALVMDPSLLLLDEPLSALDHPTQSRIIDDLRRWNATHRIPILYVTHAHREVFALGERVLVVEHGRIVADGEPHDVMEAPGQEPLARLAGFENVFSAFVAARRPEAGTMLCRLGHSATELEVPLANVAPESTVRVAIRAGDILLANEEPRGLSARNILRGSLGALRREGPTIVADVDAGERFAVHVTPSACDSLHLAPGVPVWLIIKTYSCRIVSPDAER